MIGSLDGGSGLVESDPPPGLVLVDGTGGCVAVTVTVEADGYIVLLWVTR